MNTDIQKYWDMQEIVIPKMQKKYKRKLVEKVHIIKIIAPIAFRDCYL